MCGRTASIHVIRDQRRFFVCAEKGGTIVWLFFVQYKKVIALCIIPVIAVVGLVGFEIKHGQSDRSKPLVVNQEMKALLLEQNVEMKATPAPKVPYPSEVVNSPKAIISPEATDFPLESVQPEPSAEPKKTAKPKSTPKAKPSPTVKRTENASFMINLNTAKTEELMELSGIGESKAKAIIAYRDAHPFQTLDELMNVKGIGPKIFEKIKVHLEL
jgi:comEA protein